MCRRFRLGLHEHLLRHTGCTVDVSAVCSVTNEVIFTRRNMSVAWQVEKAPVVVKSGLKKEEAEELMRKLEAGGHLLRLCMCGSLALLRCIGSAIDLHCSRREGQPGVGVEPSHSANISAACKPH